jgi:hypothetical protein
MASTHFDNFIFLNKASKLNPKNIRFEIRNFNLV